MAKWWINPFKWLDETDFLSGKQESKQKARLFLRDLLVNRPTETEALIRLAFKALNGYDIDKLLARQIEALFYAQEAKELGIRPSRHIADNLGIRIRPALRLLKRAEAKMVPFANFDTSYYRKSAYKDKQVKRMMKSKPRICAWCGVKNSPDGSKPLCKECHANHIALSKTERLVTDEWLEPEKRRVRKEHRLWAVEQLMIMGQ